PHLGGDDIVMRIRHRTEFERGVACLLDFDARLAIAGDVVAVLELGLERADMRIDAHPVADLAAEQIPDGLADILALDVPERLFDGADRRKPDDAERPECRLVQRLEDLGDVARIAADHDRLKIFDTTYYTACFPLQRGLAPPVEPGLIGLHLDENPVPVRGRGDHQRPDKRDLHGLSLTENWWGTARACARSSNTMAECDLSCGNSNADVVIRSA